MKTFVPQKPANARAIATTIDFGAASAVVNEDGTITEGTGDLTAIKEIFDRLEGRPRQQIVGPNDGPVQVEFRTIEEIRMFLLERGIDSLRVPPPPLRLVSGDKE